MVFLFIIFCSLIAKSSHFTKPFQNWDVVFNSAVVNWDQHDAHGIVEPAGTVVDVSLYKCLKHCQQRPACDFVNYHTLIHVCTFIHHTNKTAAVPTEEKNGVVHSSKADWQTDPVPHSDCLQCNLTDECVVESDQASCQPTSCGAPPTTDISVIEGNIFNIRAKLKITCNIDTTVVAHTTCADDGLWTNTHAACTGSLPTSTTTTSTSTTTTPPPAAFSCHSSDNTFRTVTLTDGTTISYSVRYDSKKDMDEAEDECNHLNANLLKVTTTARMQFVMSLTGCSAFDDYDLWIDGRMNPSTGEWTTWDGDVIPITNEFWAYGKQFDENEFCVRLNREDGFMLNNMNCHSKYHYICER